jgi:general secretion pathway protein H
VHRPCGSAGGFTLFELLVVMLILGLVAGFAVLSLGSGASRQLEHEARRLVELAGLARDESLLTGQTGALGFARDGYAFLEPVYLEDAQMTWAAREQAPLQPRSVARLGLELRLFQEGRRVVLDEDADTAHVEFSGAGELTPFELELRPGDPDAPVLRVTGLRDGRLSWETLR